MSCNVICIKLLLHLLPVWRMMTLVQISTTVQGKTTMSRTRERERQGLANQLQKHQQTWRILEKSFARKKSVLRRGPISHQGHHKKRTKRVIDSSSSSTSANCPKNVLPELETDMSERMLREETIRRMLRGVGGVDGWDSLKCEDPGHNWPGSSHFMLSCRNKCHVPSCSRFPYRETSVTVFLQLSCILRTMLKQLFNSLHLPASEFSYCQCHMS